MPPQGRAAPPILPALRSDKIGFSARWLRRSLARTLIRHSPCATSVPSFTNVKETKMTIEHHIEELRQIVAELAAAIAELDTLLENMAPD
jgi:hypothetical protein